MSTLTDVEVHGPSVGDDGHHAQLMRDLDRYSFALEVAQDLGLKLRLELNPPLSTQRHELADGLDRSLLWLAKILRCSREAQKRLGGDR